jgi:hypothetical protein
MNNFPYVEIKANIIIPKLCISTSCLCWKHKQSGLELVGQLMANAQTVHFHGFCFGVGSELGIIQAGVLRLKEVSEPLIVSVAH